MKDAKKTFTKIRAGKNAPVHPSLQQYDKLTHDQAHFRKLTGNVGYCWRYATAQALGMPYLIYEQMVRTIQPKIREAWFSKSYPFLIKDLSPEAEKKKKGPYEVSFSKPPKPERDDAGRAYDTILELKEFIKAFPNANLYREVSKGKH